VDTFSFFQALFSGYGDDPNLRLEIRCLSPKRNPSPQKTGPRCWYCLGSPYLSNAARYAISCGGEWDVYFGALPRIGHTGGQSGVAEGRVLWCDIDGGETGVEGAEALLRMAPVPSPHLTVVSGSGIHAYWFLSDTVVLSDQEERDRYKQTLRRLVRAVGGSPPAPHGDMSSADVARVLRVPDTQNHKTGLLRPVLVRSINMALPRLSYAGWRGRLPIQPPVTKPAKESGDRPEAYTRAGFVAPWLTLLAERGYPEGHRHQDLAGFGAWVVRDLGVTRCDARHLLRICADHSPGQRRISDSEIDEILRWT